ncbi:MAG: cob(I)yrinic acid a,c-diamide adenosyltransferase [Pseudomonadales bacterium]|jgi:cob(I)alamin adenosyltransferase|nr:cob(I)yrinic acid a,c-diamide adenosyltransferase [Pseudomonadales bacterium]MCP5333267.1 cob(I)yrinic acid a,c-diamide adenosyltransferase [Pseudomonadales bacterium]HMU91189.1 cob(I)yrinic acid a,c-diamide adenosyltransferase [Pseudomonadales bacterium]HMW16050.1 cob(I)yrinic acid a,c-diamide adenosyltransferase [Pseudomonadales bacterium]HMW84210.1 cob(I)yrinic acid a,c-diamide adenosyltransferase [Pseudomonadales bacterium]
MSYRLTTITTKGGDGGETSLADGQRLPKDDARIEAIGTVDELNACIGLLRTEIEPGDIINRLLEEVQQQLFDLGGELALPGSQRLKGEYVAMLEEAQSVLNDALPPLRNFVLPGGNRSAATAHLARTVCRRAERRLIHLDRQSPLNPASRIYLNRLSDLLFVIARTLLRQQSEHEAQWGVDRESDFPRR